MGSQFSNFGGYPKEYNRIVHGTYDPSRYYGKPDTPFGDVKLGELGAWLKRRNKSPRAIMGSFSRGYWRWQHKYFQPRRTSPAGIYQILVGAFVYFYIINYDRITQHRNYKYH